MKKIILLTLLIHSFVFAKLNVAVSILPELTFLQAIGGDKINPILMVKPGNSPHDYEPKPSQMKEITKAQIYLAIDVEFEHIWLPKFQNLNPKMKIVDIADGVTKLSMEQHHHGETKHETDEHKHGNSDPHIWTSPNNVKIIAKNIVDTLIKYDTSNKEYYTQNYKSFIQSIEDTQNTIHTILKDKTNRKFMVFHPAWGYFAKEFHLQQLAIEAGSKNPKPKQIAYLIAEAKEENVQAVFTAPEFSEKVARQIALEIGVPVIKVSPLNPKWSENLINLAKAIANK